MSVQMIVRGDKGVLQSRRSGLWSPNMNETPPHTRYYTTAQDIGQSLRCGRRHDFAGAGNVVGLCRG